MAVKLSKFSHSLLCAYSVLMSGVCFADSSFGAAHKRRRVCYRSFWPELGMTATFGKMGVDTRCFFAANTINSAGFEYCKYPPVWIGKDRYDFSALDRQVEDLLRANPEADFICMIDYNTPYWMARSQGMDSFSVISHLCARERWRELTKAYVEAFVAYAEQKYGDRISGYILSGGGTSEWYEYYNMITSYEKNEAWRRWCRERGLSHPSVPPSWESLFGASFEGVLYDPAKERAKIDYWRFHNWLIADAICDFAGHARQIIPKGKDIGVFFGYYFVSEWRMCSFGHLAYEKVFASADIDYVIAPGSYSSRANGEAGGSQLLYSTAFLHGKQFLHEIDHRTSTCTMGKSSHWFNTADDIAGCMREGAFSIVNHSSRWWFDMWGGWFREKALLDKISNLEKVARRYADDVSSSAADVLYVADPESMYYFNERSKLPFKSAEKFRNAISLTGRPVDFYSFSDLPKINLDRYKVVVFPASVFIDAQRESFIRNHVMKNGRTLVWFYAPGITDGKTLDAARVKNLTGVEFRTSGVNTAVYPAYRSVYVYDYDMATTDVLRRILDEAGSHSYIDDNVAVMANTRLFVVNVAKGGKKISRLPVKARTVRSVLDGDCVVARDTDAFSLDFASPDTKLFEIER